MTETHPAGLKSPETQPQITAAVVRTSGGPFVLEEVKLESLRADEVLVKIEATGLCHTDLAARHGELPTQVPVILGHEGAGRVVTVGKSVRGLAVGDPVVLTYLSCGECPECLDGQPASCAHLGSLCFGGARPDGSHAICGSHDEVLNDRFFGQSSFATYAVAHERNVVKVRSDAPLALLGPLGCGVITGAGAIWNALQVGPGASCAIYGAGSVGLSAVMAARVGGAATIIAVDLVPSRLALALELGATHIVDARSEDVVAAVRAITGGGSDFAFDTTGQVSVIQKAVTALRQRGKAALVAVSPRKSELVLNMYDLLAGCKTVQGVIEGGGSAHALIPRIVDLYMDGRFPLDRMIRRYGCRDINEAVQDSISGVTVKAVISFAEEAL